MYTYGNYRYVGDIDSTKSKRDYAFNKEYYNELISDNRYQDAANYLSNYEFTDTDRQKQQLSDIENMRRQGRIVEAVYKKIENPETLRRIEEADLIGTPGAYERLRYKKDASGNSLYKTEADFEKAYPLMAKQRNMVKLIGSSTDREATSVSLTFSNVRRGLFNIGFLAKNDDRVLQEFLNNANTTLDDLKTTLGDQAVRYNEATGETTIHIDKNNENFLSLLYAIPQHMRDKDRVKITGYDAKGEIERKDNYGLFESNMMFGPSGVGEGILQARSTGTIPQFRTNIPAAAASLAAADSSGNELINSNNTRLREFYSNSLGDNNMLAYMNKEINSIKKYKEKLFKKEEFNTLETTSTIFDLNTDKLNSIEEAYKTNKITYEQYKYMRKEAEDLVDITRDLQYVSGIYSNINSDYKDDVRLTEITQKDWRDIKNRIASTADGDLSWFAQTVNGEVGLRIVLPQIAYKAQANHTLVDVTKKEAAIWIPASAIPGMMGKLQQRINNDTRLQAEQDYNDMLNWRVSHSLSDGTKLSTDGIGIIRERDGIVTYDDSANARDRAVRDLNRDRIYNGGKFIKFEHLNANNELNDDSFENNIKNAAIAAMFDLYPELSQPAMRTFDGKVIGRDIPYSAIFDAEDVILKEQDNYPETVFKALRECRELYNRWKKDSKYYIRRNIQQK